MTRRPSGLTAEGPQTPVAEPEPAPLAVEPAPEPSAPVESSAPVEGADVLLCPAHLLGTMSLACTLECEAAGVRFIVTTSRTVYSQALVSGTVAFSGKELTRMAAAAAMDRAFPLQLQVWLERKRTELAWGLGWADAMDGVAATDVPRWTIGEVFSRLGVTLKAVQLED